MKRPQLPTWQMGSYITKIYLLLFISSIPRKTHVFYPKRKEYQYPFTEDEIPLLDEFEKYRKQNYINRSGWVKQHMKSIDQNKRQLAFRWNEKPEHQSIGLRMLLVELSIKKKIDKI